MAPMKLIAVLLVSLCLIATLYQATEVQATDVTYCTKKAYDVKVSGVEINPNPVVRGKEAKFSVFATTEAPISGGKLVIQVSLFNIQIHTEEHKLCEETLCPVTIGDFVIFHSQVLPGYTPPGTYKLTMKLVNDEKHELTCINFSFRIGFGSSVADS